MKHKVLILACAGMSFSLFASTTNEALQQQIQRLQQQTKALQTQLVQLQKQIAKKPHKSAQAPGRKKPAVSKKQIAKPIKVVSPKVGPVKSPHPFHSSAISVHTVNHPEGLYPTALLAENQVITYIAGTPVVTSPYTGDRPAFDGSDYIVNISSINRDIRLMQQRRRLYRLYQEIGYPPPNIPILALSGKSEPVATFTNPFFGKTTGDFNLGSNELDIAAILNEDVEAFVSIAFDNTPPAIGPRVGNSAFDLSLGFVNVGDLDKTPFYFTAGQLFAPFGRYASSMVSAPLPMLLARTRTRPFIVGYKSPLDSGPYAAVYGFRSDTTVGRSGVGGLNIGYVMTGPKLFADVGFGLIGSLDDAQGMQITGSAPGTTFGGFGAYPNGSEAVKKIPGSNVHANMSISRYNLTAEWVGANQRFRPQDLSFNGRGARPQAAQFEAGMTFKTFLDMPASAALGYQWSKDTLALNLPKHRIAGVFSISLWKDTIESLEYRHDINFGRNDFANGAAAPGQVNPNTLGTGKSSDTVVAQIGVYF